MNLVSTKDFTFTMVGNNCLGSVTLVSKEKSRVYDFEGRGTPKDALDAIDKLSINVFANSKKVVRNHSGFTFTINKNFSKNQDNKLANVVVSNTSNESIVSKYIVNPTKSFWGKSQSFFTSMIPTFSNVDTDDYSMKSKANNVITNNNNREVSRTNLVSTEKNIENNDNYKTKNIKNKKVEKYKEIIQTKEITSTEDLKLFVNELESQKFSFSANCNALKIVFKNIEERQNIPNGMLVNKILNRAPNVVELEFINCNIKSLCMGKPADGRYFEKEETLRTLKMIDCNNLELLQLPLMTKMTEIEIQNCQKIKKLNLRDCRRIQNLKMDLPENIVELHIEHGIFQKICLDEDSLGNKLNSPIENLIQFPNLEILCFDTAHLIENLAILTGTDILDNSYYPIKKFEFLLKFDKLKKLFLHDTSLKNLIRNSINNSDISSKVRKIKLYRYERASHFKDDLDDKYQVEKRILSLDNFNLMVHEEKLQKKLIF